MRKLLIASLSVVVLVGLLLSLNVPWATSVQISRSPAAFLPYISKAGAAALTETPTPPPSPTPTFTPTPLSPRLNIFELSGHSDPQYVDIYNTGWAAQDMTGWYIVSVIGGKTFHFPDGYILGADSLVQIENGATAVNNPPLQLLWDRGTIWNNHGDYARLYNSANVEVARACYGIGCAQH